jgi:hypothetical protein
LGIDEQKAGCPAMLFIPALVPFEQVDVDEEREEITYRRPDGTLFVDGATNA